MNWLLFLQHVLTSLNEARLDFSNFFSLKFWLSSHNNHFCKLKPLIVGMQIRASVLCEQCPLPWESDTIPQWAALLTPTWVTPAASLVGPRHEQDICPLLFSIVLISLMEIQSHSAPRTVLYDDSPELSFYFWQWTEVEPGTPNVWGKFFHWAIAPALDTALISLSKPQNINIPTSLIIYYF